MTRSSKSGTTRAGHQARRFTDGDARHFKPPSSLTERSLDDFRKRNPELTSFRPSALNMVSAVQNFPNQTRLSGKFDSYPCVEDSEVIVRDFGMLQNGISSELSQLESLKSVTNALTAQELVSASPCVRRRNRPFWGRVSDVNRVWVSTKGKVPQVPELPTLDPPSRISVEYNSERDGLARQLVRKLSNGLRRLNNVPPSLLQRQSLGKRPAAGDLEIRSVKRLKAGELGHELPAINFKLIHEQQSLAAVINQAFADVARKYEDLSVLRIEESLSHPQQPDSVTDKTKNERLSPAEGGLELKHSLLCVGTHPAHRSACYDNDISPKSPAPIGKGLGELMPEPLFSNCERDENGQQKDLGIVRGYPIRRRTHECVSSFFGGY